MSSALTRAWKHFWSRPAVERGQLARKAWRRLRSEGPHQVWGWIQRSGPPGDEAARYLQWCARHTPDRSRLAQMTSEADAFAYRPLISVITPVYNTDAHWLEACAASVRAQAYSHWQWCIGNDGSTREETRAALDRIAASDSRIRLIHAERNGGIAAATNLALGHAEGEYVALMDSDDALLPHALYEVAAHLNHVSPRADVVYSDEDKLDLNGQRCDAYFKPDWSLDLFLSSMFVCHLLVARRQLVLDVGAFRSEFDYSQDYDLMLRLMEKATRIDHIPTILYHWRKIPMSGALVGDAKPTAHTAAQKAIQDHLNRSGIQGHVEDAGPPGLHRVRYHIPATPLVSIILPTRGSASTTLSATIGALVASTDYANFEVVIVSDDGAVPEEARATLARVPHRIERSARGDAPFNLSATINQGVAASRGEHVLVLHDDAQPRNRDWLTAMLELSTQPGIGAVGAKLFYPHGALQHAGLILGVNGVAGRPFQGHSPATLGYYSGAICIRGYSAVSGACLMTRREVFERVGGFDEGLPLHWSDVDYCLKVGAGGYRVVFTPYAELTHAEAGQLEQLPPAAGSLERLRARWGDRLARDPYYNPNLTREFLDYRVAVE